MTGRSPETCDGIAMTKNRTMLDLSNIQGNILRGYASFPHAQFLYLSIHSADDARALLRQLLNTDSVTPAQWRVKPDATLNVALTFEGLRALGLPEESLASFPAEFQQGMKRRAKELGDVWDSSPDKWDEPWKTHCVHILVMMYGKTSTAVQARCLTLRQLLPPGIQELAPDQAAGRLQIGDRITPKEHFGFVDGLTNPDVEGVPGDEGPERSQDVGNPNGKGGFRKIPASSHPWRCRTFSLRMRPISSCASWNRTCQNSGAILNGKWNRLLGYCPAVSLSAPMRKNFWLPR